MTTSFVSSPAASSTELAEELRARAERVLECRRAAVDPAYFLDHVRMVDERTAEEFRFYLGDEYGERDGHPEHPWHWQRKELDALHAHSRSIRLKARQLGLTWLTAAYGNLWIPLYRRGSLTLIYRQTETEAQEILERVWEMYWSLPAHLRNGAEVRKPSRGAPPSNVIEWVFPDGRVSESRAMASTSAAGHGRTVAFALLDEFSRIERASDVMKSVQPAVGSKGKIAIVSTANGVANLETGEGNYFAYLWENAKESGFDRRFLSWRLHPDRNDEWYAHSPEVRGLRSHERAEQYPDTPDEAFTLTNLTFFDPEAMSWYAQNAMRSPLYSFEFEPVDSTKAQRRKRDDGRINLYAEPSPDRSYAIGADASSGRGADYSAAYVVDLASLEVVAEYHGKLEPDQFAYQLHYLGRWFNTAWVIVEAADGYGAAVLTSLRDGREGRPAYPKLYRHNLESRIDQPLMKTYGYPLSAKNRKHVTSYFEQLVREKALPYLTHDLLLQMKHFVVMPHGPSPAAQDGTHDDRVFAACYALEAFRQYGVHPDRYKRRQVGEWVPARPWEAKGTVAKAKVRSTFKLAGVTVDRDGVPLERKRKPKRRKREAA